MSYTLITVVILCELVATACMAAIIYILSQYHEESNADDLMSKLGVTGTIKGFVVYDGSIPDITTHDGVTAHDVGNGMLMVVHGVNNEQ